MQGPGRLRRATASSIADAWVTPCASGSSRWRSPRRQGVPPVPTQRPRVTRCGPRGTRRAGPVRRRWLKGESRPPPHQPGIDSTRSVISSPGLRFSREKSSLGRRPRGRSLGSGRPLTMRVPRNVLQGIAYVRSALMTIAWLRCGLIHDAPSASRGVMRPRLRWLRLPRIFAAA